jgi:hypothetical protein
MKRGKRISRTYLEHGSDIKGDLVGLSQSTLPDQLNDLCQLVVLLQDLPEDGTRVVETGVVLLVEWFQVLEVVGVGQAGENEVGQMNWNLEARCRKDDSLPVDRREMLPLSCGRTSDDHQSMSLSQPSDHSKHTELLIKTPAENVNLFVSTNPPTNERRPTHKQETIPKVAVVTGSEKSPPGGETL